MEFAEQLREKRREKGMTQDALAEALDVSRQAVAKWEAGQSFPSTENLLELRELLGIIPDKKEEPPKEQPPAAPQKLEARTKKKPAKPHRGRRTLVALAILAAFGLGYLAGTHSGDGEQSGVDTLLSIEAKAIVENMDMEQILDYVETTVEPGESDDRFCVCAARLLGYDSKHLYVYVYTAHYYKGQPTIPSTGHSWYAVSLDVDYSGGRVTVTGFATAEEGMEYGTSMSELFPQAIRAQIDALGREELDAMEAELEARAMEKLEG